MIYSPALCSISPPLCGHTTPPRAPWLPEDTPPRSRINIIRHFRYHMQTINISLSIVSEIFELRLPRFQFLRGLVVEANAVDVMQQNSLRKPSDVTDAENNAADEARRDLRREIRLWWQDLSDHIEKLVGPFHPFYLPISSYYYRRNVSVRKMIRNSESLFQEYPPQATSI